MRTLVWDGPNAMHVEDAPEPDDPGPGELILRPEAVGICGSEVEGYLGHMGNRTPPLVMGHEFAGTVVATGEGASSLDGARVAVNPLSGCGKCRLCLAGDTNLCRDRVLVGVHVPGAFADFVKVRAVDARRLPDDVSARVGALMEPLANGVHGVRLAPKDVESAVVMGAGTIGLVTLQAALLHGVKEVVLPKPGAKSAKRIAHEQQRWFRRGRDWRAGIEGRISGLKRRHKLDRCRYHGTAGMERWVGWGVITHNLRVIAQATAGEPAR